MIVNYNFPDQEIEIINSAGKLIGNLRLITNLVASDSKTCELLAEWRNNNKNSFLTQFDSTPERTRNWLLNTVIPDSSRKMFLIVDINEELIGHIGVRRIDSSIVEIDNMIRGKSGGSSQLMFWAEVNLLRWLFEVQKKESACLFIFTNNWIPISLHQTIGFKIIEAYPLVKKDVGDEIHYVVDDAEGRVEKFKYAKMMLESTVFRHFLIDRMRGE